MQNGYKSNIESYLVNLLLITFKVVRDTLVTCIKSNF